MESILTSIKLLLGIGEDYTHYDPQVIIHINSVFSLHLRQLGVGPNKSFRIEDDSATWADFTPESEDLTWDAVKTYVYARVKLIFDPPASSAHIQVLKETIQEFECRLGEDAKFTDTSE